MKRKLIKLIVVIALILVVTPTSVFANVDTEEDGMVIPEVVEVQEEEINDTSEDVAFVSETKDPIVESETEPNTEGVGGIEIFTTNVEAEGEEVTEPETVDVITLNEPSETDFDEISEGSEEPEEENPMVNPAIEEAVKRYIANGGDSTDVSDLKIPVSEMDNLAGQLSLEEDGFIIIDNGKYITSIEPDLADVWDDEEDEQKIVSPSASVESDNTENNESLVEESVEENEELAPRMYITEPSVNEESEPESESFPAKAWGLMQSAMCILGYAVLKK